LFTVVYGLFDGFFRFVRQLIEIEWVEHKSKRYIGCGMYCIDVVKNFKVELDVKFDRSLDHQSSIFKEFQTITGV
jgi:hypothetical protein